MEAVFNFLLSDIMVRFYSVSLISAGILAMTWYTSMINSKKAGKKIDREISPNVHLLSAFLNILASIVVSWRYDRMEYKNPLDWIIEGAIFGVVATGFYFVITSDRFLQIFKIWRKK